MASWTGWRSELIRCVRTVVDLQAFSPWRADRRRDSRSTPRRHTHVIRRRPRRRVRSALPPIRIVPRGSRDGSLPRSGAPMRQPQDSSATTLSSCSGVTRVPSGTSTGSSAGAGSGRLPALCVDHAPGRHSRASTSRPWSHRRWSRGTTRGRPWSGRARRDPDRVSTVSTSPSSCPGPLAAMGFLPSVVSSDGRARKPRHVAGCRGRSSDCSVAREVRCMALVFPLLLRRRRPVTAAPATGVPGRALSRAAAAVLAAAAVARAQPAGNRRWRACGRVGPLAAPALPVPASSRGRSVDAELTLLTETRAFVPPEASAEYVVRPSPARRAGL